MSRLVIAFLAVLFGCSSRDSHEWRESLASRGSGLGANALTIAVVYAGGGNTGATFDRDYVVVVNRSSLPVSTGDMSLQYASASGTSSLGATDLARTEMPLVMLDPGHALLVPLAFGAGAGAPLPAGDVVDETPIPLSTSGGRLALVTGVEALGCNGGSLPCDDAARARVVDLVGWGAASWSEASPVPAPSNTQALVRRGDGCVDTDSNASDFERTDPVVRTVDDVARQCSSVEPRDAGVLDAGLVDSGAAPADASTDSAGPGAVPDASVPLSVHPSAIEGDTYLSPLEGAATTGLEGIVTYVEPRRFAIEVEGAPLDSNAVFVRTESASGVNPGARVRVDGIVRESRPKCGGCPDGESPVLSVTTVDATRIVVLGRAPLPLPVDIDPSFPSRISRFAGGADLDSVSSLEPESNALDRFERLEARRVRFERSQVVGATRIRSDGRRALAITADGAPDARNVFGLLPDPGPDHFGGAFVIVDTPALALPLLDVGDTFEGPLVGVVDTEAGRPIVRVIEWASAKHRAPLPAPRPVFAEDSLSIATFNVHGISANDSALRFATLARVVVDDLGAPTLVVLEEVADDSGAADDGVVGSSMTRERLVDAIVSAGGPIYTSVQIDPRDGADGGAPGANIRSVLLLRTDRDVSLYARGGDGNAPILGRRGDGFAFSPNPARIGNDDSAFLDGRKPLVVELVWRGESLVVVCVHLRSHLGDAPRLGRMQPPARPSDSRRLEQSERIAEFLDALYASSYRAVLVAGDFNDGPESDSMAPFAARGYLPATPDDPSDVATFVYDGIATSFDRVLVSQSLAASVRSARPVHVAAVRSNGASDHDPVLVELGPRVRGRAAGGCAFASRPPSESLGLRCATWFAAILLGLRRSRRCP